ncbi:MAG TPA: winged helix DNA-binding protein [Sphingobium sp.]|nr:winged helix DNA-binding protein [Sphingobium sp.]
MSVASSRHRNSHLVANEPESYLADFEFALLRFREAFEHWVVDATKATTDIDLTFAELCILHTVRVQGRPTGGGGVARMLNRDDIPNIHYILRKLAKMKLILPLKEKGGRAVNYSVTPEGVQLTNAYAEIKRAILWDDLNEVAKLNEKLSNCTRTLSMLTGVYEEAARAAATYSPEKE